MGQLVTIKNQIANGMMDETFARLYGNNKDTILYQRNRYLNALKAFEALYPEVCEVSIFSAPGRSEICGNHTDHNNGKTLAAAVNLDIIGIAARSEKRIEVHSEGFNPNILSADDIELCSQQKNSAAALIKGVCKGFVNRGYSYGGFVAYTTSNVIKGSGISSSAAFEVFISAVLNHFYNNDEVDAVTIAQISQFAENEYFGKPSGLLDQTACSVGGFITIDFKESKMPKIEKISFDFESKGYALFIVTTGGNHSDLTDEYSAIPSEMKSVAEYFGKKELRGIDRQEIIKNAAKLREKLGDRAVLRALHFVDENDRVDMAADALKDNDFDAFLTAVKASGRSSFMYLQNIYTNQNPTEQGLSLALCICDGLLKSDGAYRVHGGGFGGTILAFVPVKKIAEFQKTMDDVFGLDACKVLGVRAEGGVVVAE